MWNDSSVRAPVTAVLVTVVIGTCSRVWALPPSDEHLTNLARSSNTYVSASSINGGHEPENPYHGVTNLFDGGTHVVNGINYTFWLSQPNDVPWVLVELPGTATIHEVLLEFGNVEPPASECCCPQPSCLRCCDTRVAPDRPREFAIDLIVQHGDAEAVVKFPSEEVTGFRQIHEFHPPAEKVRRVRVMFPGYIMASVAEIEVLGVPDVPAEFPPGNPRVRSPE